jgi:hypothetical protein
VRGFLLWYGAGDDPRPSKEFTLGEGFPMGDSPLMFAVKNVLEVLRGMKSENRTERDRYIAIAITEVEKIMAFLSFFVDYDE